MNVSSPTHAADNNEPQQSTTDLIAQPSTPPLSSSKYQQQSQCTDPLPSVQVTGSCATNQTRLSAEKLQRQFVSQATAAALSLCADSPEDETPLSTHPSKHSLANLNRSNRKCKSAIITVDGRSFTIGKMIMLILKL